MELPETEYCLEPDEIASLVRNEAIAADRKEHLTNCHLCQQVLASAKKGDESMGKVLATFASGHPPRP
jgi:hypothetical protein